MNTAVLLSTFGLIFVAELGDKTQLAAMALAARYPWKQIFLGIAASFAILNALAVVAGEVLFALVPAQWIEIAAGALFLFFGAKALLSQGDDEGEGAGRARGATPFFAAFTMIFLAELGDKTQLATAGLAAQANAPVEVFLGSSAALWIVSLLGILAGSQLVRVVPMRWIRRSAGCLFLVFGAAAWYKALT